MKKYIALFAIVLFIAACAGKQDKNRQQKDLNAYKTHSLSLMYNGDTGYIWFLNKPENLKMVQLVSEESTKGAFEPTRLGNPHTQTFTFKLIKPSIKEETVVFHFNHPLERHDTPPEGVREFVLRASDFAK
ncbi:hypothetical protein Emin_1001 [Elusimicrobium minutum Pei191]|uniref:Proteinase inhibitor I42 chagasin domain-containing protein n=1 Tax=Elusimicrobium minutum (strain Pei191) TaxID=445932 RepID=B2KDF8_ELUMP|nr:protease inhibitor I42 family protein [Elusimicrobium minutum]ACC98554.1 hypothetical protein Emin_1001 [Elusimicrobium minutum Pei191]